MVKWNHRTALTLTLTQILLKVKADNSGIKWEYALSLALMAKNCLSNGHGYSAYQLVFGHQLIYRAGEKTVYTAVFYWSDENGDLVGVLASHVDDRWRKTISLFKDWTTTVDCKQEPS